MAHEHFVITGNGPAGNQAARTLRKEAPEARITLISRDRVSAYRPHLLPRLIAGRMEEPDFYQCPIESYKEAGIKLRCGQEVVDLDPEKRALTLDHKEIISFDGLIIAVGGRPWIPEPLWAFKGLMLTLKTLEDAQIWVEKLQRSDSVLMIGGDLTSLSMTRTLLELDKKVYFILNEDAFWPLRCNEALFSDVSRRLREKGVEVFEHRNLEDIKLEKDDTIRVLVDEREIRVGLIGAFFGLVPDIGFLARSGLAIDRGILVDETLGTGFDGIYATGDCAQIYHPDIRDYWVSIGHDNALALGRMAALNLLGGRYKTEIAPESIFDARGIKVNTSWWMEF